MTAIFISHSSPDNAMAAEIKSWLAGLGYENIFLDFDKDTGLGAGRKWERQLYEAVDRCHAVILVVTPAWMDSLREALVAAVCRSTQPATLACREAVIGRFHRKRGAC